MWRTVGRLGCLVSIQSLHSLIELCRSYCISLNTALNDVLSKETSTMCALIWRTIAHAFWAHLNSLEWWGNRDVWGLFTTLPCTCRRRSSIPFRAHEFPFRSSNRAGQLKLLSPERACLKRSVLVWSAPAESAQIAIAPFIIVVTTCNYALDACVRLLLLQSTARTVVKCGTRQDSHSKTLACTHSNIYIYCEICNHITLIIRLYNCTLLGVTWTFKLTRHCYIKQLRSYRST